MSPVVRKAFFLASKLFGRSRQAYEQEYDRIAPTYDEAATRPLLSDITRRTIAASHIRRGSICLDLGCGTGDATEQILAKAGKNGQVHVCDLSREMLSKAMTRLSSHGNVSFEHAAMETFVSQFADESVDWIGSFWALEYAVHAEVLREARRALRPGGIFCAALNHADSLEELQELVTPILLRHPYMLKSIPPLNFIADSGAFEKLARDEGLVTVNLEKGRCSFRFGTGAELAAWIRYGGPAAGLVGSVRPKHLDRILSLIAEAADRRGGIGLTFRYSIYTGTK